MRLIIPDFFAPLKMPGRIALRGYTQTDSYRCGISAGWSVVKYLAPGPDFNQFYDDCSAKPVWGVSTKNIVRALRRQCLTVSIRKADTEGMCNAIAEGKPVLISIGNERDDYHWIVVYGCTDKKILFAGRIMPGFSKGRMSWNKFSELREETMLVVSYVGRQRYQRRQQPQQHRQP